MSTWVKSAYLNVGRGTGGHGRPWRPAIVNGTEVEPQRNGWSCGPASLRYCLLVHGINVEVERLARWAGSTRAGTDDTQLRRAASRAGCSFAEYTRRSPVTVRRLIESKLKLGTPMIACVERWQHWVAVLHRSRRGFLVLDSSRPGPVIQLWSWKKLERRLRLVYSYRHRALFKRDRRPIYYVLALPKPVQPRRR